MVLKIREWRAINPRTVQSAHRPAGVKNYSAVEYFSYLKVSTIILSNTCPHRSFIRHVYGLLILYVSQLSKEPL
jgi:hypothetical protein